MVTGTTSGANGKLAAFGLNFSVPVSPKSSPGKPETAQAAWCVVLLAFRLVASTQRLQAQGGLGTPIGLPGKEAS